MGDSGGGLIFIVTTLIQASILGRIVYLLAKRRNVLRSVTTFVGIILIYTVALVAVSLISEDRMIALGDTECFDDWCVSVLSATTSGTTITLDVRVQNNARRSAQSPDHPRIVLIDANGVSHIPGSVTPTDLAKKLQPGETFDTNVSFNLDDGVGPNKALVTEGSGPPLIGDQNSWLHRKTYFTL